MTFNIINQLVPLHGQDWFEKQKTAGLIHSELMKEVINLLESGELNMTYSELSEYGNSFITKRNATPTFLGFKGFPAALCISVNEEVVHGIPKDTKPKLGDVVSIDFGVTVEGAIADAAYTTVVGGLEHTTKSVAEMLRLCHKSLNNGISSINSPGTRIGAIGNAVYKTVKNNPYGLIINYGGHGITWNKPHAPPFVGNKADSSFGVRIQPGMSIAIEPMLNLSRSNKTQTLSDNWTVVTEGIGCHFEHTLFIQEDGSPFIITENELNHG